MSRSANGDTLYNLRLDLPAGLDDARVGGIASCLEEQALAVSMMRRDNRHDQPWTVTWLIGFRPDDKRIAALAAATGTPAGDWRVEPVPPANWLEHCYRQFRPFSVGPFFIHGSHYEDIPPAGVIPLQIDAATAFGSGEHGTTKGCLLALHDLHRAGFSPERVLDMGTGSGILAIAARVLWAKEVLAVDIDAEAVRVAARHAALNQAGGIAFVEGDGFSDTRVSAARPFSLIIANILAGPLVDMAGELCAAAAGGGYAVLSGLLASQADGVVSAYAARGMRLERREDHDGWATLVLKKPD